MRCRALTVLTLALCGSFQPGLDLLEIPNNEERSGSLTSLSLSTGGRILPWDEVTTWIGDHQLEYLHLSTRPSSTGTPVSVSIALSLS